MNLLLVATHFPPSQGYGGVSESACGLARHLRRLGVNVRVLSTDATLGGRLPWNALRHVQEGVSIRRARFLGFPRWGFAPSFVSEFRRMAAKCDLVHIMGVVTYPNTTAAICSFLSGIPYLVSLHGGLQPWIMQRARWKRAPFYRLICLPLLRRAACLHVTADMELAGARKFRLATPYTVIPNGVSVDDQPADYSDSDMNMPLALDGRKVVLFLGRLSVEKGLDVLIRAWPEISRRHKDAVLLIAGPAGDGYAGDLRRMIEREGAADTAFLVGQVLGRQKKALLERADVVVLPSYTENFGMVVVEALAAGTPVVATTGTPWEILQKTDAGRWVQPDPDAIAASVAELLALPDADREAMADRGRRLVAENYTWESVARKMVTVYRCILEGHDIPLYPVHSRRGPQSRSAPSANEAALMRRRATFVSQYFYPEPNATSEMLSGIAFKLAERGLHVDIVSGQPTYHSSADVPRRMTEGRLSIYRLPSTRMHRKTALGRIANTASFTASVMGAFLLRHGRTLMLPVTNPPTLPWAAAFVRRIKGTPFVLIIHDVYPDIAAALGFLRSGSAVERLWRRLTSWAYRKASYIITLGPCMQEKVRAGLPAAERRKVVVIPNWADGDAIRPRLRERHPFLVEHGIDNRFVLQYSGNIGLFHEVDTLLLAAERLADRDVHFLFIGQGGQSDRLAREVNRRRLANVTLLPFQPKEKLPETLTACDLGLVTLKHGVEGLAVPSKFYGILAAGKPVLGVMPQGSDIALAVREHDCGVVVEPGDVDGLIEQIMRLKQSPEVLRDLGSAARKAYEEHYSLEKVADQYFRLLTAAVASNS